MLVERTQNREVLSHALPFVPGLRRLRVAVVDRRVESGLALYSVNISWKYFRAQP